MAKMSFRSGVLPGGTAQVLETRRQVRSAAAFAFSRELPQPKKARALLSGVSAAYRSFSLRLLCRCAIGKTADRGRQNCENH